MTPMHHSLSTAAVIRFDDFEVDLPAGRLFRRGRRVRLREQSFTVLSVLLQRHGEVVTREALRHQLWSEGVFVDFDNNLNAAVSRLRAALGDSPEHPRFVETLPRHGYRFVGKLLEPSAENRAAPPRRARLLVLPFAYLSGHSKQEYFSDLIMEEMITELAGLAPGRLGVIARTTAMQYKGSGKDVARINRELQLDFLVEGSVHWVEDRVAMNFQLIQARDQTHLLARRYECDQCEILEAVSAAATAIVEQIGLDVKEDGRE